MFRIAFGTPAARSLFERTFPTLFRSANRRPAVFVLLSEGYGAPFTDYEIGIERGLRWTLYSRTDYRIEADENFKTVTVRVYDGLALKHAFMHLYSLLIVHAKWGLLFHASCVADQAGCYLFAGHSGAGKSTAAGLSRPRGIIADEAAVIRIRPDGAAVFHSPFRSDDQSRAFGENGSWPLNAIYLLRQAEKHERAALSKWEGFIRLTDLVFFWNPGSGETRTIIRLLQLLVDQVPQFDLYFRKDPDFWELISS
ncbi:hypothetical protein [Paenibacillus humicola]|uniref:hypothetical protein n=1 Tax=Paenibacillus humicola TaxID=3110540 RepID=UPI00237AE29F|nr:hypothetical protein [Paenibacillus humicola]